MAEKRAKGSGSPRALRRKADRGPGIRLTFADRYRLLELHRSNPGWSYDRLSAESGIGSETVRLTLIAASKNAADLMAAYAEPVLRQWLRASKVASTRGDHRPSKDWLLHAGSIEPLPDTARGTGPAVVIINSPLPGMPGAEIIVGSTTVGRAGTPIEGGKGTTPTIEGGNRTTPDGLPAPESVQARGNSEG